MTLERYLEMNIEITEKSLKEKDCEIIKDFLQTRLSIFKSIQDDIGLIIDL